MMASSNPASAVAQPRRSVEAGPPQLLLLDLSRGSFHYDIMVTLILLFIFITPHLWDYGAKPSPIAATSHPIQVIRKRPRRHHYRCRLPT